MYLSPYKLIEQILGEAPTEEGGSLDHSQRKALVEFGFHETPALELGGMTVTRAQAQAAFKELRDPEKRRVHWLIYQCPALLDFLTHGRIDGLLRAEAPPVLYDKGMRRLVGPLFADAFGRALFEAYRRGGPQEAERRLGLMCLVPPEYEDRCYMLLYGALRQDIQSLTQEIRGWYAQQSSRRQDSVGGSRLSSMLAALDNPSSCPPDGVRFLNALPRYFQGLRNELGLAINDEAAEMCRRRMVCWRGVLALAGSLHLNGHAEALVRRNLDRSANAIAKRSFWRFDNDMAWLCTFAFLVLTIIAVAFLETSCEAWRP